MENIIKPLFNKVGEVTDEFFIQPIKVRLSNPFFSSFIISFIVINWRPILYLLFSKSSIETKIEYINIHYYGCNTFGSLWMYLCLPTIIGLIYTFSWPWINNFIDYANKKPLSEKDENVHELTQKKYVYEEDYAILQNRIAIKRSSSMEIETLNLQIDAYIKDIELKSEKLKILEKDNLYLTEKQQDLEEQLSNLVLSSSKLHESYKTTSTLYSLSLKFTDNVLKEDFIDNTKIKLYSIFEQIGIKEIEIRLDLDRNLLSTSFYAKDFDFLTLYKMINNISDTRIIYLGT